MRHGSLFSGVGGFDLAAEWMGWENMFHCEWNQFGQKVLKYYWPNAISYDDICKTDFTIWRGRIDILTGGFPCQPYSMAGKRQGTEDSRHLWPEMLRAIRECQPTWIVGENVPGLINWSGGLVFEQVCADLEGEGYEVQPIVLPASGVNAPHRRDRVWFVAYRTSGRSGGVRHEIEETRPREGNELSGSEYRLSDSERPPQNPNENGRGGYEWNNSNTINKGLQRCKNIGSIGGSRTESDKQPSGLFRTDWTEFPTQSPLRSGNDGFSSRLDGITFPKWRNESIKAGGNAIVPQVALQIFKVIDEMQKSWKQY